MADKNILSLKMSTRGMLRNIPQKILNIVLKMNKLSFLVKYITLTKLKKEVLCYENSKSRKRFVM